MAIWPFHESLGCAGTDESHRGRGDRVSLRVANDDFVKFDLGFRGKIPDVPLGANQDWPDPAAVASDAHRLQHGRVIAASNGDRCRTCPSIGVVIEPLESIDAHRDRPRRLRHTTREEIPPHDVGRASQNQDRQVLFRVNPAATIFVPAVGRSGRIGEIGLEIASAKNGGIFAQQTIGSISQHTASRRQAVLEYRGV